MGIITTRQYDNSHNTIRLLAAFQVMLGHMVEHLALPISDTALKLIYFFRGVPIFFMISGFLMWASIGRSNSYSQYIKRRFWRIYPELWVSVAIDILVLVFLYSKSNIKDLFLFGLAQSTVFQFWTPDSLRDYGVGTPNGALWTIGVMIQFYIIAWFFYKIMRNKKVYVWIIGFVFSFFISILGSYITREIIGIEIVGKLYDQTILKFFWLFYIGMFIAKYKDRLIPIVSKFWYVLLAIAFVFFITGLDLFSGYYLFWSIFLSVGLVGFAYRFPRLSINLDISYGLFLYHMIIVNIFVYVGIIGNWLNALAVCIVAIMIAYLSTITIGAWAAKRKRLKPLDTKA